MRATAHDSARGDRASRFHSSGSERGDRSEHRDHRDHRDAAPAADFAADDDDRDLGGFDGFHDFDGGGDRDGLSSLADGLIDDLLPPEIDWRRVVRRHPWPALFLAGLGGYLLGRSQGKTLVRALSALAVARVEAEVLDRIEGDLD